MADYQLRYAAGIYWLIDIEQPGVPYRKPVPLNSLGGDIWKRYITGMRQTDIASEIAEKYGVPMEQVSADIDNFLMQLSDMGITDDKWRKADDK